MFKNGPTKHIKSINFNAASQQLAGGPAAGAKPLNPPPPRRGTGRVKGALAPVKGSCLTLQVLKAQGGPPLPPAPPKSDPKSDQKSNQKKVQNFDPKWSPKGTLKISKISPNLQNGTLKHLSRALLAASISERVSKPSPRTSITSKIIVLL